MGKPIPASFIPPELSDYESLILEIFDKLGSVRGHGEPGRIPYREIDYWCDREGYDDDLKEDMQYLISKVDSHYLATIHEERERKRKQKLGNKK